MSNTQPLFPSTPNFRELGGLINARGRPVKQGLVYRSELLTPLSSRELGVIRGLQIQSVFDLRNPHERAAKMPVWPAQADDVRRHLMAQELPVAGADLRQLVSSLNEGRLTAHATEEIMRKTYRKMPHHFSGVLRDLFDTLTQESGAATLVHCTAGKDRTGFVCAMVLSALDVSVEVILQDYLLSAKFYTVQRLMERLEQTSGVRMESHATGALAAMVQVRPEYMEESWRTIDAHWGSIPAYLEQCVGLDKQKQALLQSSLLA